EGAGLEQHAERRATRALVADARDAHPAALRLFEPDHVAHERRLAGPRAAENRKDVTGIDREGQVAHEDPVAPADRQLLHLDDRLAHRPYRLKTTVKSASMTTSAKRLATTADVVER